MRGRVLTGFTGFLFVACSNSVDGAPPPLALTTEAESTGTGTQTTATGAQPTLTASTPTVTTPTVTASTPSSTGGGGSGGAGMPTPTSTATNDSGLGTAGTGAPSGTTTATTPPATTPTVTNTEAPTPVGDSTCMSGVQTGTACNPAADTEPCVRSDRSCLCSADSTWTCSPVGEGSAGTGNTGSGGSGGMPGSAGTAGSSNGGGTGTGGAGGGAGAVEIDCDATLPTSGAEQHSNTWAQGGMDNLAWQVWTNGGPGTLTTYAGAPAFVASWNNSGDYLGRMGFEWGNAGKAYTEYGTIKADYVWNKSGTAGQYSYIGVYGWSNNPCVEWYIVEDSFHQMPFNTGDRPVGTAEVDGGTYNLVYRHTQGTGGDRCGGAGSWDQFYSIRLEGKRCGTITVSDHFKVWADQGWNLGSLLEVKIVVEAAAGQGSVEFPLANVTTSQ